MPLKYGSRLTVILIFDIAHVTQRELLHSKRLWEVTSHQQRPKNLQEIFTSFKIRDSVHIKTMKHLVKEIKRRDDYANRVNES